MVLAFNSFLKKDFYYALNFFVDEIPFCIPISSSFWEVAESYVDPFHSWRSLTCLWVLTLSINVSEALTGVLVDLAEQPITVNSC